MRRQYSLLVPSGFGGRAGFDINIGHLFPQGELPAVTLVGGGTGVGWATDNVSRGFSSAQWLTLLCIQGRVGCHDAGAEALKVKSKLAMFPLRV